MSEFKDTMDNFQNNKKDEFERELKKIREAYSLISVGTLNLLKILEEINKEHKNSALATMVVNILSSNTFNPLLVNSAIELASELIKDTDNYYNIKEKKDLLEYLRKRNPEFAQHIPPQHHNHS